MVLCITSSVGADTLTIVKAGSGFGVVASDVGVIDCGMTCVDNIANNTAITLSATPQPGSQFTGWLGPCTGTGTCQFAIDGNTTVQATFASPVITTAMLDIDGNASCDALSDGLLALRFLFGLSGSSLISNAVGDGATRMSTGEIGGFLVDARPALDIDGNGQADALTDGLLAIRYLFGLRGNSLIAGAIGPNPTRSTAPLIQTEIEKLCAPPSAAFTLTVALSGNGAGTVTSDVAGIVCGMDCTESYSPGTPVTLTATSAGGSPVTDSTFVGWSGACSGTGTCMLTMDAAKSVSAQFELKPNIAVTSSLHTGSIAGLPGADAICQSRATESNLPGTDKAYLSTSTVNAIERLGVASGWVRVDGKPIASSAADFAVGRFFYPLRLTNAGAEIGDVRVKTATTNGLLSNSGTTCGDYTSTADSITSGTAAGQFSMFSNFGSSSCNEVTPLYCVGVDRAAAVRIAPLPNRRRVFVTEAQWTPGSGTQSADAVCASEAAAAALPAGTYLAFLATSSASAASRFDTMGLPWGRADGALLAPTALAAMTASSWDTAPGLSADGTQYFGNTAVWSGAASPMMTGTSASTCSNWMSSVGATGTGGRAGFSTIAGLMGQDPANSCSATHISLVCLQQ